MRLYSLSNTLALCVAGLAFDFSSSTPSFYRATPTYDKDGAGASSVVPALDEPFTLCRTTQVRLHSIQRACGGVCGKMEEREQRFFSQACRLSAAEHGVQQNSARPRRRLVCVVPSSRTHVLPQR